MATEQETKKTYHTVRINYEDRSKLKYLAYKEDKTIVSLISEAVDLLEKKYKNKLDWDDC